MVKDRRSHPAKTLLDPIITMNAGGFIQSASDSVEQVFGWTPTELFGRNVKVLIPEPKRSSLDRYLDRYRHADMADSLQRTRRFAAVRKDGRVIQIELSMSRADLPSHDTPYFIGIVRDVTQQIDVSADTTVERSRMQHLITEQTRALATANLRLQLTDRLASLGTLAAGLGHDMNNVLLPVRARLNALEHAGVPPAALAHIKAVRRSISYLQHLSDGLHFLALDPDGPSATQSGEGTTNLRSWWDQMGSLLSKALPKNVRMNVSISKTLPDVMIAPHWLTQAMLNLIVNASEAIPVSRRNPRVLLHAAVAEDGGAVKVRLGVSDNGRGMTHVVQRRAFDPFFTTKPRGMGTGLGLPLVRKVAVRAGGNVEIRSVPGRGTTVELVLPVAEPTAAGRSKRKSPALLAALTIKDHRTSALVTQILIGAGVRVTAGRGGKPGNAALWVTRPSLKALGDAQRWRSGKNHRSIVLLGAPSAVSQKRWAALGAAVIDPSDDFEAMRHTLGQVAMSREQSEPPQRRSPNAS